MPWAPDYVTLAELKAYLRIGDVDDDPELSPAIAAASRAVDQHCKRQFGLVTAAEQRFYTAGWDRRRKRWTATIDDLMTTTGLVISVPSTGAFPAGHIPTADVDLEPINAADKARPWTAIAVKAAAAIKPTTTEYDLEVVASWGWTTVPVAIKQATLLQASRFFSRRTSPYGIAGSPELGSELRLLARVDPDVAVTLAPYERWWAAA